MTLIGTAFVINNYICGIGLIHDFLPNRMWDSIHVSETGGVVLYVLAIFLVYLLKSMGYSDESLSGIDKWIHPPIWVFTALYFYAIWHFKAISNAISLCLLVFSSGFSIGVTIYIVVRNKKIYKKTGEVNSPLISSTKKDVINFPFATFHFLDPRFS